MEAIILAGGLGTRLRQVVQDLPKPLAPVAGRPFLAILLEYLASRGFASAVLSVGYKHELIRSEFGGAFAGLRIRYAVEDRPLGTGGAIRLAARQCDAGEVFVMNGDTYVELEFDAMRAAHRAAGARLSVCTAQVPDVARYGAVVLEGDRISGFTASGSAGPGRINAGVYLMAGDLLEGMGLPDAFSFERDVLTPKVGALRPLAFPARGLFIDIGVPADYARAQQIFARP
jgi:D-glycero-alpha-D-manno-heptose 1-phosphate guanylyltransferase